MEIQWNLWHDEAEKGVSGFKHILTYLWQNEKISFKQHCKNMFLLISFWLVSNKLASIVYIPIWGLWIIHSCCGKFSQSTVGFPCFRFWIDQLTLCCFVFWKTWTTKRLDMNRMYRIDMTWIVPYVFCIMLGIYMNWWGSMFFHYAFMFSCILGFWQTSFPVATIKYFKKYVFCRVM